MHDGDLKEQGNALFHAKDFEGAAAKYSAALEQDGGNHVLYSNRAACLLELGKFAEALADADRCTELKADWAKGHYRRALALRELGRLRESRAAVHAALECPDASRAVFERLQAQLQRAIRKQDLEAPIASPDHWLDVFADQTDMKLRLGTLVFFWNNSKRTERLLILRRFLDRIRGEGEDGAFGAEHFTADQMSRLPLKNYQDLVVPSNWIEFYRAMPADLKVETLARTWDACTSAERDLIVADLRYFFVEMNPGMASGQATS